MNKGAVMLTSIKSHAGLDPGHGIPAAVFRIAVLPFIGGAT